MDCLRKATRLDNSEETAIYLSHVFFFELDDFIFKGDITVIMGNKAPEPANEAPPVPVAECREGEFGETEALENSDHEYCHECCHECYHNECLLSSPHYAPTLSALCYDSISNPCNNYKFASTEREEEKSLRIEDTDNREQKCFFARAKKGYTDLISAIIRPPRLLYDPKTELGPSKFMFHNRLYKRTDFEMVRMAVVCSHPSLHCITPKIREEVNHLLLN